MNFLLPYFYRTDLLNFFFSKYWWRKSTKEKVIYLTFDDGPVPVYTDWVLGQLRQYEAKATFFCVGENIQNYPSIFTKIMEEGHSVGNHTHNHLDGWRTLNTVYRENIRLCQQEMDKFDLNGKPALFRPPYGKIKNSQFSTIEKEYQVVMWDVVTGDFDTRVSPEVCWENARKLTRNGSIVVFHDSEKASPNLYYTLPRFLEYFAKQGFRFEKL